MSPAADRALAWSTLAIAGMILFGESRDGLRILFILLIVGGIIGLKIVS